MASDALNKQILEEIRGLDSNPITGIVVEQNGKNALHVSISGPEGSPYEGGVFKFDMSLSDDYPKVPPKVKFITKIYHPNIDNRGNVSLDILQDKWNPSFQIRTVLEKFHALLSDPKPDDSLDNEINDLWKKNEQQAIMAAKEWTAMYAIVF